MGEVSVSKAKEGARTMAVAVTPGNFRDSLQKYLPTELFGGFPRLQTDIPDIPD